MDVFVIIMVIVIVVAITIFAYTKISDEARDGRFAVEMRRIKSEKDKDEQYNLLIKDLESQYGKTTLEIPLVGDKEITNRVLFFETSSIAVVAGTSINFRKIIAYTLTDNQQTITTTTGNADTSTSTGSMAGRALVGGILLGGVGALAGATTAKKDTDISTTTSHTTTHDYIIYLSVDDMANPQRILKFGSDAESANKAASVFNIIINRNNQKS